LHIQVTVGRHFSGEKVAGHILLQHATLRINFEADCTECGRKKSPIWEANKIETKEDTANVFLFLESTQNAVLRQRVLKKKSLKWRP